MLEEYKQIIAAYFDLAKQKTDMFQFYLALVTIPATLIAAVFSIEKTTMSLLDIPEIVVFMLFAVAIAGLIVTAVIVDIRFESISYVKTVNILRKFFSDRDKSVSLERYLVLPVTDEFPRFYEQPWDFKEKKWRWELGVGSTFLEVLLMGLLNTAYLGLAALNTMRVWLPQSQIVSTIVALFLIAVFFACHVAGYAYFGRKKDQSWSSRQVKSKQSLKRTLGQSDQVGKIED